MRTVPPRQFGPVLSDNPVFRPQRVTSGGTTNFSIVEAYDNLVRLIHMSETPWQVIPLPTDSNQLQRGPRSDKGGRSIVANRGGVVVVTQ
jgi:hypothetical protein